ncbi:sarcosine oxidase subunit gamma [Chelativorans salis]|uniref:Sarcosine oxidase subunit gamma n=1 Tax=Chelativorans salis TaxID=2978478 RepID=A0ABT2LT52_9HYPH|nr:sarcosine oxidase subunit gamma [Chelativorans sp. EGI FJ00035]MCT7377707.1 sarcosine oxidase subunit gamma [Chelativorans sp. EGI FJ00035]
MAETARRISALEGRAYQGPGIALNPAAPASRLSLRAPEASLAALSKALGLILPRKPKTTAESGKRAALWLGPDEWLLIDEGGADLTVLCAKASALHSAVDISHRNTAILVAGEHTEDVLGAGCPQALSLARFPIGAASRTVFGKAEVVLWRIAEDAFRIECWRSFSYYVFSLLEKAAREV